MCKVATDKSKQKFSLNARIINKQTLHLDFSSLDKLLGYKSGQLYRANHCFHEYKQWA